LELRRTSTPAAGYQQGGQQHGTRASDSISVTTKVSKVVMIMVPETANTVSRGQRAGGAEFEVPAR